MRRRIIGWSGALVGGVAGWVVLIMVGVWAWRSWGDLLAALRDTIRR